MTVNNNLIGLAIRAYFSEGGGIITLDELSAHISRRLDIRQDHSFKERVSECVRTNEDYELIEGYNIVLLKKWKST